MNVKCEILRSKTGAGSNHNHDIYQLEIRPPENILGILIKINHELDASLSFRFACGVVKCGECAVEVNGIPCLACEKTVEEKVRIGPLSNLPLIKDLVIDRRAVLDHILQKAKGLAEVKKDETFHVADPNNIDTFVRLSNCYECLVCMSVCPVFKEVQDTFIGPLGMVWLAQIAMDPDKRDVIQEDTDTALEMCVQCGICSDHCPCSEDIIDLAIETLENL
jgi:succinate dehydrogenase/fumarate reductase iron-sulfur protein